MAGPSAGTNPRRASVRDSSPSRQTGMPPMWASHTTAVSAPRQAAHRSSGSLSASTTARSTERMSNGFLRSGLSSAEKTSPTVCWSVPFTSAWSDVADVPVHRVARGGAAREPLARDDERVVVVPEQDAAGVLEVRRPVLRLAVGAHHPVVAADAEVVLGRDAAGEVQRLLAGQHHRAGRQS